MQRNFEVIANHTIVCGYGRNGRQTVKELISHNKIVVVIESSPEIIEELEQFPNAHYVIGDATSDDALQMANISNAAALITTLPKDADNLFVVVSARVFNPDLPIVSRASQVKSRKKLLSAGANHVIMPDKLGGLRMAQLVMQPDIVEFIDYILMQEVDQVNLEEISCNAFNEKFVEGSIRNLDVRKQSGANILGIYTKERGFIINPPADFSINEACYVFALGTPEQIENLKKLIITKV
jgi:voltage-gated potassium channel